jgi:hypothetical protein
LERVYAIWGLQASDDILLENIFAE